MAVHLHDLLDVPLSDSRLTGPMEFLEHPKIRSLHWPDEVVQQWLWDHGHRPAFLTDYGSVDLTRVGWTLESVPVDDFSSMETGPSDPDLIDYYAGLHEYALKVRRRIPGLVESWKDGGTWMVPPLVIAKELLDTRSSGLQLVEGRTRVGVLRGRREAGLQVARTHETWVGRPRC